MGRWFRAKSRLELLKKKYTDLMRKSYNTALKDRRESDRFSRQAEKIFKEIQYLSLKNADK